ncbi:hypothetical protein VP01_792g7 [Puccinia sorghi]|uniref:HAT C-terminal dimerisation domain-containing protein n=1 Tax=Puccinia sorghi TaxID=27349 RepID=A0A0L6UAR8_9BASI|nr:hypothetical protein VP01_792g7 [Puccinia sorghi]
MIMKLGEDQEEVRGFETLVMATFLHSAFQMRFFAHFWPEKEQTKFCVNNMECLPGPCFDIDFFLSLYYTIPASSCADKKTFSSAANIFSSVCGSFKPQKIESCVSSDMWLKQGIKVIGKFHKA